MAARLLICILGVGSLACLLTIQGGVAAAGESTVAVSSTTALFLAAGGDEAQHAYEGSKSCKKCHIAIYKSWEETAHGKALETLKPGNAVEMKQKHNLDPDKDYSTDPACVQCHVVGFGKHGGYQIPDAADEKAVKAAAELAGVGCEACHGPGEEYNKLFKEIMKDKRKYKLEELTAIGLMKPDAEACMGCHNDKSPTFKADEKFDYEKMKEKGMHERQALELREG